MLLSVEIAVERLRIESAELHGQDVHTAIAVDSVA